MKHFFIPPIFILVCLLCLVSPTHAANDQVPTVEFTAPLHFLTPGGEDVEVGPGIFEVEAAEAWLKLVPEGEGPASAVLLEATPGTHDEMVTEPAVRLEGAAENPDVVHLGLLLANGTGLEAIGTKSGIRPRALNFAFVGKTSKAKPLAARPKIPLPGRVGQKVQIELDRIDIIDDGDPVFGAGELRLVVGVVHTSPDCPKHEQWPELRICRSWKYEKAFKAKSGETKNLSHVIPTTAQFVEVQPDDGINIYVYVVEKDYNLCYSPLIIFCGGRSELGSQEPPPDHRHTARNDWGVGSQSIRESGSATQGRSPEYRLHYRIRAFRPDVVLQDFRTIPRVMNPGYPETKLCVKVRNVGNVLSASYFPVIYVDDMSRPYFALRNQPALPPVGGSHVYCEMIRTPGEGRHRMRVTLIMRNQGYDQSSANNQLEKNVESNERPTHQTRWRKVREQVNLYGAQVAELKQGLGLNAASAPRHPPRVIPARAPAPVLFAAANVERPARIGGGGERNTLAAQYQYKQEGRLKRLAKVVPKKPGGSKRLPPRRPGINQQEVRGLVVSIKSRLLRIQDEANMLRHAYQLVESKQSATAAEEIVIKARELYEVSGKLEQWVREYKLDAIQAAVASLDRGMRYMKERLNAARKFA